MKTDDEPLLTAEELRVELKLKDHRALMRLINKRKLPYVKLDHRNWRFSLPAVKAALAKLEVKEAGRS